MKAASVRELKKELNQRSRDELLELCLTLSKFKKENKELLTYHLFESENENYFIHQIKNEVELQFQQINTKSFFYIKKSVRKILRYIKKNIRYSKKKTTEVDLLIHFCEQLKNMQPSMKRSIALVNIYNRQIVMVKKSINTFHEDLQYDFNEMLNELNN